MTESRIPEPDQSPEGPTWEGRPLVRTDEEVVDQGAGFDIRTLVSRRQVLGVAGISIAGAVLAACTATGTASTGSSTQTAPATTKATASEVAVPGAEIPDETAGPYPGDGSNGPDALEESGIIRSDIRSSLDGGTTATGVPMTLTLTILDMQNGDAPFESVAVYVWHCDAQGGYSMYSNGIENETYLRGVQVSDANGQVTFTSIFPACYSGRWPHIHFEVYPTVDDIVDSANAIATSQVALPEADCNAVYALSEYSGSAENMSQVTLTSDNVFGDDGGALQLATTSGDTSRGYAVALAVRIDASTTPTAGNAPGGGFSG
ncbi:intradiol ring-cleavage dioxygenase [Gulosibacter molinativorax]|uniref:3,4-dioxygenase subunit beta n=1 Tax=Gulosibacter molinativorax TaxID=256821 RepID=A0ABT7CA73_9MICO|nr:intradiol ring-cleavage dioxygenase [Gulosibacter molinativorax]MDJ1372101.1 3,4-dioxygenase subunit beta [Gulosibacter molinativorax]QUY62355.1 3,4-dioxygenase subunit beta [Gulosibacter molinativorax]